LILSDYFRKIKHSIGRYNNNKTLVYIHIGKCGGATLKNAINKSDVIANQYSKILTVHLVKPPIYNNSHYAIVLRNPIKRAISAFNWRFKLVVTDQIQKNRFQNEYSILAKYENLNNLAERLYIGNELDKKVANDFQKIHHLKENISFYLMPLLDKINKDQIFAVFVCENLNEDIRAILGVDNKSNVHKNDDPIPEYKKTLSDSGYKNLKRYLSYDYNCIKKAFELKNIKLSSYNKLII